MIPAMTPGLRRFALTAHTTFSVGLLGSIAAFLALAVTGLVSQDAGTVRYAYPAMELIARFVIIPLAFASLLSGIIQSLGTPWGLFRHYWILAKLSLTAFAIIVLLVKMERIGYAARLAKETILSRADLHTVGRQLVVHATGGLLVLLLPVVLSVYKPWSLTPYGQRKQHEQHSPSQSYVPSRRPSLSSSSGMGIGSGSQSITITLRRTYVLAFIAIVAAAHMVILHLVAGGLGHH